MPDNCGNATACDQVQNVATVPWLAQAISQRALSQSPFYFRQELTAGADIWRHDCTAVEYSWKHWRAWDQE